MSDDAKFYIVAIGVSAGGQEPLWSFFDQIPPKLGIAFIVIPHLDREYVSIADQLSGAGTDGTRGAIAIHNQQGMVMVQDPQSAQFTGMPRSAILNDHPTQVADPKRLANALIAFVS